MPPLTPPPAVAAACAVVSWNRKSIINLALNDNCGLLL